MKYTAFSSSTPESAFDDWFNEEHTETDDDVDDVEYEQMSDPYED